MSNNKISVLNISDKAVFNDSVLEIKCSTSEATLACDLNNTMANSAIVLTVDNAERARVSSTGLTVTGAVSATTSIIVNRSGTTVPTAITTNALQLVGGTGESVNALLDTFAATPFIYGRRAAGVPGTPTATQSGSNLLAVSGRGYGTTNYVSDSARILFQASENFTDSAIGAKILIQAVPTGSTTIGTVGEFSSIGLTVTGIVSATGNVTTSGGYVGYSTSGTIHAISSTGYNGPVGATTPSTGAFTAVSATQDTTNAILNVRNTAAGAAKYARASLGNDTNANQIELYTFSSTYTESAWEKRLGGALVVLGSAGLSVASQSGDVRVFAGSLSAPVGLFTSTGLAVTGDLSATGNGSFGRYATFSHTTNPFIRLAKTNSTARTLDINGGDSFQLSWATGGSGAFVFDASGNVGVGTLSPEVRLDLAGADGAVLYQKLRSYSSTAWQAPRIGTYRYRGTQASPTAVATGDELFSLEVSGRNANGTDTFSGGMGWYATGTVSGNNIPTYFSISTNTTNSAVERMRIDSSGAVGIGAAASAGTLHITSGPSISDTQLALTRTSVGTVTFRVDGSAGLIVNAGSGDRLTLSSGGDLVVARSIQATNYDAAGCTYRAVAGAGGSGILQFTNAAITVQWGSLYATGTGMNLGTDIAIPIALRTNGTNHLTIDSGGYVGIGTAPYSTYRLNLYSNNSGGLSVEEATSGSVAIRFSTSSGLAGYISTSGTTTSYVTTSDERFKENVRDFSAGDIIDTLRPRIFDWKGGIKDHIGFVAQELHAVYPQAVAVGRDTEDGEIEMPWGVDFSKLVPVLVAELKSVRARLAVLEKLA